MPDEKTQRLILLVDDDPLIIKMYHTKLVNDGFKVNTAFNGEEALIQVKKEKPDLIYLDVMMPKMNGVDTLKALKADPQTSSIPIIILTNLGDKTDDIQKAKDLGAIDYIIKSQISLRQLSERAEQVTTMTPETFSQMPPTTQWDNFFQ